MLEPATARGPLEQRPLTRHPARHAHLDDDLDDQAVPGIHETRLGRQELLLHAQVALRAVVSLSGACWSSRKNANHGMAAAAAGAGGLMRVGAELLELVVMQLCLHQ